MPRFIFHYLAAMVLAGALPGHAVTYYVDAALGSDKDGGKTPGAAWKSLVKCNSVDFAPGDSLLFKSGGMWPGQLIPKGSGAKGNPIVIATFGGTAKALIDGNGVVGQAAFYLNGGSDWDISGLEITNDADKPGDRRGVLIDGPGARVHLHDLSVHNIAGIPATPLLGNSSPEALAAKSTGGISLTHGGKDYLIERCDIYHVDNTGLFTSGDYTGLHIRNNTVHDIAKNAMIIRGADDQSVVEYNVCYQTCVRGVTTGNTIFSANCKGTTFQYNEGYANNSTGGFDGSLYDCDIGGGSGTKWQYSYSHDNNHGLMWFCTVASDTGIKVRYNISQNDKGNIFNFAFPLGHADIYNNTVYIGAERNPTIIREENQKYGYAFYNNIIYNLSGGAKYSFANADRVFDYNVFYGNHPAGEPKDDHKLISDPMFFAPGSGRTGINTLSGYQLLEGSPCINSGMVIAGNGNLDYAGNPIYQAPDRGAFERQANTSILDPRAMRDGLMGVPFTGNPGKGARLFFKVENGKAVDASGKQ